ncbi:hypothetical protein [Streptomyces mirabilis]
MSSQEAGIPALDEGLTGQRLLQQAGKNLCRHLLRMQWAGHALKGVSLYGSVVAAIEIAKGIDLSLAYSEHQGCVRKRLL